MPQRSASSRAAGRLDLHAGGSDAVGDPSRRVGDVLEHAALHQRRLLLQQLDMRLRLSSVPATSTSVVCGSGCLEERLELLERPRRRLALALRHQQRLACSTMTTRRGAIIGSVRTAVDQRATAAASLSRW